jgi:hypothetical protein
VVEVGDPDVVLAAEAPLASDLQHIFASCRGQLASPLPPKVVATICALVINYRREREEQQRLESERKRFVTWHGEALERLATWSAWLSKDPIVPPRGPDPSGDLYEQLAFERERLVQQMNQFRQWLEWIYDSMPRGGRPVDWVRADLEEEIGNVLAPCRIEPTLAQNGLYVRILREAVHPAIGLAETDFAAYSAARAAIQRHPEWRQSGKRQNPGQNNQV